MMIPIALILATLSQAQSQSYQYNSIDPSSYSNLDQVRTDFYEINLTIDFDSQMVSSIVTYNFTVFKKTDHIVLDIAGLEIRSVYLVEGKGKPL
jgi:aminopeptidase N